MAGLGIVKKDQDVVTVNKLKEMFPKKKGTITQETADMINEASKDPLFNGETLINQMLTYESVMKNNRCSMKEYINALKFCAYLEANGDNYTDAYKYARATDEFVQARKDVPTDSIEYRELTNAASRYRRSSLVTSILTQADVPLYLLFQGARYQAVMTLATEMTTAPYSKDRISAADKLLTHVKPPENMKMELEVGPNETAKDMQEQLNNQLAVIIGNQKRMLDAGLDITEAQKLGISMREAEEIVDVEE